MGVDEDKLKLFLCRARRNALSFVDNSGAASGSSNDCYDADGNAVVGGAGVSSGAGTSKTIKITYSIPYDLQYKTITIPKKSGTIEVPQNTTIEQFKKNFLDGIFDKNVRWALKIKEFERDPKRHRFNFTVYSENPNTKLTEDMSIEIYFDFTELDI